MPPTRRALAFVAVGATALAACTQQQVDDTAKKIASIIQEVQAGVAAACAAAGKVIPTANSVLAVLTAITGGNPAVATAAQIAQVISQIVAVGCPPAGRPTAAPTVNGANIEFY